MPHYTNLDVNTDKTPSKQVVCKYCGRQLKQGSSLNQGCGDICRQKHRNARYRVIETKSREVSSFERFKEDE